MNHEDEINPLASTYFGDMLSVRLRALAEFQQTQTEETREIDRMTLIGFFFEIRKIADEAINHLMEDKE